MKLGLAMVRIHLRERHAYLAAKGMRLSSGGLAARKQKAPLRGKRRFASGCNWRRPAAALPATWFRRRRPSRKGRPACLDDPDDTVFGRALFWGHTDMLRRTMPIMIFAGAAILLGAAAPAPVNMEARILPPAAAAGEAVKPFVKVAAGKIALTHLRVIDGTGAPAQPDRTLL